MAMELDVNTIKEVFEEYPILKDILKSGYLRKYQIQDILDITKAETTAVMDKLIVAGAVKMTPFGYKMLVKTQKELESKGVM